jgi:glucose/mannose-6-phosphate isomerase
MIELDDLEVHREIDHSDMYSRIIHLPEQILKAYNEVNVFLPDSFAEIQLSRIKKIALCGMGGSAIAADIAKSAFRTVLPITVTKSYEIPIIDPNTLVIALSYSGNTEEVLSCVDNAMSKTKYIAAITSGGKLAGMLGNNFYRINLPQGFPPRSAIGYLFFSLMKLMEDFQIIPDQRKVVNAAIANLIKKAGAIASSVPQEENLAKSSAAAIKGKIPIIYTSNPHLDPLGYRWKCQINENAKYPAFNNTFPEMNHNEIEGWEKADLTDDFIPVFLRDLNDRSVYKKRMNVFKKILGESKVEYLDFIVEGDSDVEKIFSLIYLGDMISYYLAILNKVDPTRIDFIERFKKKIKEKERT